jgi:hypothetical protein
MFDKPNRLLSERVYIEQQCVTMAFYLSSMIYSNKVTFKDFTTYFNKDDIKFLWQYYEGFVDNDLKIKI